MNDEGIERANPRPFTNAIKDVRRRTDSYADVAKQIEHVRSTSWLTKLVASNDPWVAHPPEADLLPLFARAFRVSEPRVREMVAREWYTVDAFALGPVATALVGMIDDLEDDELTMVVVGLVNELSASGQLEPGLAHRLLTVLSVKRDQGDMSA